ncbi:MAG: hypothetical protein R2865_09960 [Deinococcales bacterium]
MNILPSDPESLEAARNEALSYANYRLLSYRFRDSPGRESSLRRFDKLFADLGYDAGYISRNYQMASAALGNYLAGCILSYGSQDGANEENRYANSYYYPINPPLAPFEPGNPLMTDPNHWQPLALEVFIDQGGNPTVGGATNFIGAE